jgi:hypothetical protein
MLRLIHFLLIHYFPLSTMFNKISWYICHFVSFWTKFEMSCHDKCEYIYMTFTIKVSIKFIYFLFQPQRSKSNPEDNSHLLQVTHTAKGNPSIIYKSHTFLLEKVFVDKISFRCRHHKRKCSARLYTSDFVKDNCPPRLLAENGSHNHAYVVLPSYLRVRFLIQYNVNLSNVKNK